MLLQSLQLKSSYESKVDDLVQDFYVPVLECAVNYDRIAGFFSSSSLAVASQGIAALIANSGHMRLLASPRLNKQDAEIIHRVTQSPEEFVQKRMLDDLETLGSEIERDHISALGWMLANDYLEIQLVEPLDDKGKVSNGGEIFHQKIGVVRDGSGRRISFSGSINESASGWLSNIEEFKVFRDWLPGQEEFVDIDETRFETYWNHQNQFVRVSDLPSAVKEKLITYGDDFDREEYIARYYQKIKAKRSAAQKVDNNLSLFWYQKAAMEKWIGNGCRMLFEMATGTGKTRTALACVNHLMKTNKQIIVVIACPEATLSRQWESNEVKPAGFIFDQSIIADGTNTKWRTQLPTAINKIIAGYRNNLIIYTTHTTSCNKDFIPIIESVPLRIPVCFVGDEAHGLGAFQSKKALVERYNYRIGLSATPERWFDDVGTTVLHRFFGEESYEFTIADALTNFNPITKKTFLVNYFYHLIFVQLSEKEIEKYMQLSKRISKLSRINKNKEDEYHKLYENLLFARADIQKNAESKMYALESLLRSMKGDTRNLLIFTSPEQINNVMSLLKELKIPAHRFTQSEGTKKSENYGELSEREYIIHHFKKGVFHALVAISCLDEGIDIPSADKAILMANSTNPREYIQRIGRVIRQAPNKKKADIYDFIVTPDRSGVFPDELREFEMKVFKKEVVRVEEMAKNAINNAQVQIEIDHIV